MSSQKSQESEIMTQDEIKAYMCHLKKYSDTINEVFESNKKTNDVNNTILLYKRKKLALEQQLNTIK